MSELSLNFLTNDDGYLGERFRALLRSIRLSDGFSLFILTVNFPAFEEALIDALSGSLGASKVAVVVVEPGVPSLWNVLRALTSGKLNRDSVVVVRGIANATGDVDSRPESSEFVRGLNLHRDQIVRTVPCPLLLMVPSFVLQAIAVGASDFFSIRSGVFSFALEASAAHQWSGELVDPRQATVCGGSLQERDRQIAFLLFVLNEMKNAPADRRDDSTLAAHLVALGALLGDSGMYVDALFALREAEVCASRAFGSHDVRVAHIKVNLGNLFLEMGDVPLAQKTLREAYDIYKTQLGEKHPQVAIGFQQLGHVCRELQQFDRAAAFYRSSMSLLEEYISTAPNDLVAKGALAGVINDVGEMLLQRGENDRAMAEFLRAEKLAREARGDVHLDVAAAINCQASVMYRQRKYDEAIQTHKRAIAILGDTHGNVHPHFATTLGNIASALLASGKFDEAKASYAVAVERLEAVYGPHHLRVLRLKYGLAKAYYATGAGSEAGALLSDVIVGHLRARGAVGYEFVGYIKLALERKLDVVAIARRAGVSERSVLEMSKLKRTHPQLQRIGIRRGGSLKPWRKQ